MSDYCYNCEKLDNELHQLEQRLADMESLLWRFSDPEIDCEEIKRSIAKVKGELHV